MLTCADVEARIEDLAMGIVDAGEARTLHQHINGCAGCTASLAAENALEVQLRAALQVTPPAGLANAIKAALPAQRSRVRRWLMPAVAVAAALVLSFTLGRTTQSPTASAPTNFISRGDSTLALTHGHRTVQVGDRVTVQGRHTIAVGGATVTLHTAEVEILKTARGAGPEIRLLRGRVDVRLEDAAAPFEIETSAGQVLSRGGRFSLMLDPEQKQEVVMRGKIALVALTAVATALIVKAFDGDVDLSNAHGKARVPAGASGGAVNGARPARFDADKELRDKLADARTTLADKSRRIKRLEAQVAQLKEGQEPAEVRPAAEILAELKELSKEHGMNLYATMGRDHPLFKELQAMGPEGIKLLTNLLKTGSDTERFVAAALMEKLLDPSAIPALSDALFGENKGNLLVQRMVSHALAIIGGEQSIAPLEQVLTDGPEWGVKANAAFGLAQMGRDSGVEWLMDTYQNGEDPMMKAALLPAMAEVGDKRYLPIMHQILQEETEYSRRTIALVGITKASQPDSLPILEALIDDPQADKMLLVAAKKAFNEIAGTDKYPVE